MSLPKPVLPARVDGAVKRVVEELAARNKVAAGTYVKQKLELTLLQSITKRAWREHGFSHCVRILAPQLLRRRPRLSAVGRETDTESDD